MEEPEFTTDPMKYIDALGLSNINVCEMERAGSLLAGGILALFGLSRFSLRGLAIASLAGVLIWRGLTGHCFVYQAAGISTVTPTPSANGNGKKNVAIKPSRKDVVTEASWESFPASDPPAWSGGSIT